MQTWGALVEIRAGKMNCFPTAADPVRHSRLFSLCMWYRKWKHEMEILCLEKLKVLFDKQDKSIHKTWTFPFWVNSLSFSSLGLKSQHVFRHPSHGLSSQMKNEGLNLAVRHSASSVLSHTCAHCFGMLVLPAKDQHTPGVLFPSSLLQKTEVSSSKTVEVQMPPLIPVFDNVIEAKTQLHFAILPPSTCSKLLAMVLARFGHPEKRGAKLCHLPRAVYPLWIFGCRTVKRSQGSNPRAAQSTAGLCPHSVPCGLLLPSVVRLIPQLLWEQELEKAHTWTSFQSRI